MNTVDLYKETNKEFVYGEIIKKVIMEACKLERLKNVNCSIIIVDNDYIHKLNKTYRNIDRPTDVITFALEDDKKCLVGGDVRLLGDIYISLDKAKEQAREYNHSLERELCFLAIHGFYNY